MKTFVLSVFILLTFLLNAKDAINFQATVRDLNGKAISMQNIGVQMTIYKDSLNQNMIYQENHFTHTNEYGLVNLKIGLGQVVYGNLDTINWGKGTYYIQVSYDFAGGTSFETLGSGQILYVPTSLYAKKSGGLDFVNMSDSVYDNLATKLNLENQPTVLDAKIVNTNYSPLGETRDVVVYQSKSLFSIEAVLGRIAVTRTNWDQFKIGENGVDSLFDTTVDFNNLTFPNLIPGSYIDKIILLPWHRNSILPVPNNGWRCCVITTKGQIYHNFPNRTPEPGLPDGAVQDGDLNRWQESVVWDLPTHRLPSKTSDIFPYTLNPCLPDSAYILFPEINQVSEYGNGGFGLTTTQQVSDQSVVFPRFYFHRRLNGTSPVSYMGGFETSHKIQIIGSYSSNTSPETTSRVCVFVTTDGGRQWFNKYEFASHMPASFGNALIGSKISGNYVQGNLSLQKRNFIVPTSAVKEPVEFFSYDSEIIVDAIQKSDSLVVNTVVPHGLISGDLIVLKKNQPEVVTDFDFLCNDQINTTNGGNGKIWKVRVISPTSIKLYEYVHSADSNLPVRHIHAINRLKDGFLISTGENYPDSWIIYLQLKSSDTYAPVFAWENFNFLRLNSSETGIQRTLGTIMLDDADQTIVFASDEATIPGAIYGVAGRPSLALSRSSIGVYKGKLADIDDFSKFSCIYEATQTAFHFKEINGMWIFGGQQGELAISIDKGITWRRFQIKGTELEIRYPKGVDNLGRYYLDQVIIYRK